MNKEEFQIVLTSAMLTVVNKVLLNIGIFCIIIVIISFVTGAYDKDSTDGESRSGMQLHIDNMTGCHYLSGKNGGITPRLNDIGEHICSDAIST